MKVKAQISFSGAVSMRQGEERELDEESEALKDLLQAGYVVGIDLAQTEPEPPKDTKSKKKVEGE